MTSRIDRGIVDRLALYREHPAQMVRELFAAEPDGWQEEVLEAFPHNPRLAMKSAKGPGKSTTLAWLGWNYLLTRPHPKIGAVSITAQNLADGLWTEMAKWMGKSPFLQKQFTWTKTRIFANDHPETWFMAFKSWSKSSNANEQADTLAGFHADYVLFLIDESGSMPRAIIVTAEAALSGTKEAHIVQAGNPTSLEGALYHACNIARGLWFVVEITGDPDNPKRSARIPVEYAREQIKQYGRDNPWILVNVFGQFPPSSFNALIGYEEVRASMARYYREHEIGQAARVLGVDVARFGDDASVIAKRQGIQMFPLLKYRNVDSTQGAGVVSRAWNDWSADAAFIDGTGGFGSGWIDQLRTMGKSPISVEFAGQAHNKGRYYNKRAEMYFDLVEWVKRGGALPDDENLLAALTNTTYTFKGDRFLLEPKDSVKLKLNGMSPDEADACALTFAEPVSAKASPLRARQQALADYNPFASMNTLVQESYDPFRGMS